MCRLCVSTPPPALSLSLLHVGGKKTAHGKCDQQLEEEKGDKKEKENGGAGETKEMEKHEQKGHAEGRDRERVHKHRKRSNL